MVQLSGPNSRIGKAPAVLVTLTKLHGPGTPEARKPRLLEVIHRIRQRPHRCVCAGPRQHTNVSTLEGVGPGRPSPASPLHLREMGMHARVD